MLIEKKTNFELNIFNKDLMVDFLRIILFWNHFTSLSSDIYLQSMVLTGMRQMSLLLCLSHCKILDVAVVYYEVKSALQRKTLEVNDNSHEKFLKKLLSGVDFQL